MLHRASRDFAIFVAKIMTSLFLKTQRTNHAKAGSLSDVASHGLLSNLDNNGGGGAVARRPVF